MNDASIAILVPAYNEEKSIRQVVEKLLNFSQSVIVINDGSSDRTAQEIQHLPITLLTHAKNRGKGNALLTGFNYAVSNHFKAVITIDADTQHDPQDIPRFISAMQQFPNHLLIGARLQNRENAPLSRLRANQIADFFISWASGHKILDTQSGYRLYPIKMLLDCIQEKEASIREAQFGFETKILIQGVQKGYAPAILPIHSYYPHTRPSHYKPVMDTFRIAQIIGKELILGFGCVRGFIQAISNKALLI